MAQMVERRRRRSFEGAPLFVCDDCGYMGTEPTHPNCDGVVRRMICHRCHDPIVGGEPRFTGGEHRGRYSHYECKRMDDEKLDRDLRHLSGKAKLVGVALADMLKRLKL